MTQATDNSGEGKRDQAHRAKFAVRLLTLMVCRRTAQFSKGTDVPVQYLFAYLDEGYNLYTFMKYFPSVGMEQAVAAIRAREHVNADDIIHSERGRMSGTPVFKRVARCRLTTLFNYMSYGYPLDEFLEAFPSVEREQASFGAGDGRQNYGDLRL